MNIQLFARFTGILYLLMVPLGYFGIMYVPGTLVVEGDITATISNILDNETMFRLAIVFALVIQLLHFWLVLVFYKLLKPVNRGIAQIMVLLVMVGIPIAMLGELNFGAVLHLIGSEDASPALVALFLDMHHYGVIIVQIFWGLWLFPLGYLVYKSTYIPKIIGIILMIGCFGYVADSFIYFFNPDFGFSFSAYLFIGEVILPVWLVAKGINVARWNEVTGVTAS